MLFSKIPSNGNRRGISTCAERKKSIASRCANRTAFGAGARFSKLRARRSRAIGQQGSAKLDKRPATFITSVYRGCATLQRIRVASPREDRFISEIIQDGSPLPTVSLSLSHIIFKRGAIYSTSTLFRTGISSRLPTLWRCPSNDRRDIPGDIAMTLECILMMHFWMHS